MGEKERLDFVQSFWAKRNWDENDTQILEIIMEDGDDRLWQSCALAFLKHPDRDRAVEFLIDRLKKYESDHEPANYIQALGISKNPRAVAAIRPYFEKYRKEMEAEKVSGIPDDVIFGPIPYSQYFGVCEAFLKITGSVEYEEAIRKYLVTQTNKFDGGQSTPWESMDLPRQNGRPFFGKGEPKNETLEEKVSS